MDLAVLVSVGASLVAIIGGGYKLFRLVALGAAKLTKLEDKISNIETNHLHTINENINTLNKRVTKLDEDINDLAVRISKQEATCKTTREQLFGDWTAK